MYRGVQAYLDPRGINTAGDKDDQDDDDAGFKHRFSHELAEYVWISIRDNVISLTNRLRAIRTQLGFIPPDEVDKRFPTVGIATVYRKLVEEKVD